jgi:hypothetical protein
MMRAELADAGGSGALIVTGFHRSGTSAAARLLRRGGVHLGDRLIGARASNPHGHFEDVEIVGLHDRLLALQGLTWRTDHDRSLEVGEKGIEALGEIARRRAQRGLWGFKDPRACYFLDAWWRVVPEARIVGIIRHPAGAVASLHRRESRLARSLGGDHRRFWDQPDLGLRMWIAYNRRLAEAARRSCDAVLLVSFARLRAGAPLLEAVVRRWGMAVDPVPALAAVDPAFPAGPPPRLRTGSEVAAEAAELWSGLAELEAASWHREEVAGD